MTLLETTANNLYNRTSAESQARKENKFHHLLFENGGLTYWSKRPHVLDMVVFMVLLYIIILLYCYII